MKKIIIFLLVILFLAGVLGVGIYFSAKGLPAWGWKKIDVGNLITEVSKDILTPPPLQIPGQPSQSVLTKSGIILQTNLQRQENGNLPALKENANLNAAASAKVKDMFLNQYFEHTSPTGVGPGQLVLNNGYKYIVAGENLILGNFESEKELVQAWMDSPGHRANILNSRYSEIGVAIVKGTYKGETVWMGVQEFGLPLSSCAEPDENLKNEIDNKKFQLDQMSSQLDFKKSEIDNTNKRNPQYNILVDAYNQLIEQYQTLASDVKILILQYNNQVNIFNDCVKGL